MQSRRKYKIRNDVDVLVVGVTGDVAAPTTLVLADLEGAGRIIGSTTVLTRAAARELARHLAPTGETVTRRRPFTSADEEPDTVHLVERFVVEVEADVARLGGSLRHAVRYRRARPDLSGRPQ